MNNSLLLNLKKAKVKELFDSKSHFHQMLIYEPDNAMGIKLAHPQVSNQYQTLVQNMVCEYMRDWVIS